MPEPIGRDRLLIVVSAAQLATGVAGMAIGLRRRHPYDVFWMHGDADAIGRDAIFKGTALSAPVSNMVIQAAMTGVMARWPSRLAAQALGGWGALLVAGYLGERLYGNACGHRGGILWSHRCSWRQSDWQRPWPGSAGGVGKRR
jgi:hypothetical protein